MDIDLAQKRLALMENVTIVLDGAVRSLVPHEQEPSYGQLYRAILQKYQPISPTQSCDFDWEFEGHRWRGNLYHSMTGWNIALKRLPAQIPSLKELGFERVDDVLSVIRGGKLVLFIGPTDAGKTTTLAASVHTLFKAGLLGQTTSIEEPIEYLYPSEFMISQRGVGADVASFQEGVHQAVRQSMDTIIIGEIRDRGTAHAAVAAGMTGHRVFATLHGDSIINGLARLFTLLGSEYGEVLSEALTGAVAQHLITTEGDKKLLIYETFLNDRNAQAVLRGGAGQLAHLSNELYSQYRKTLVEQVVELSKAGVLAPDFLKNWRPSATSRFPGDTI